MRDLGVLTIGLVIAVLGPASQGSATDVGRHYVDCAAGAVTLTTAGASYVLIGSCGHVTVVARNATVTLSDARRLDVPGDRDRIIANGRVGTLVVGGSHDRVRVRRGRTRVTVTGHHDRVQVHRRRPAAGERRQS